MTEMLLGLTFIFIVYVLYEVFKTVSCIQQTYAGPRVDLPEPVPASMAPVALKAAPEAVSLVAETVVSIDSEVLEKDSTEESDILEDAPDDSEAVHSATAKQNEKIVMLRNPEDGETCIAPTNYRFAKKWIKKALVTEGLLNKMYKNSELTVTVNNTVKDALMKFKRIKKYHA